MADNHLGDLFRGIGGFIGARKNKRAAEQARQRQFDLIQSLDWDPTTTAELAPAYQRSQSPVARAYLESFLLGQNPDSVMPGDPEAAAKKRQMQHAQNQMYGTPQARAEREAAYRATTPWAIDPAKIQAIKDRNQQRRNVVAYDQKRKSPEEEAAHRILEELEKNGNAPWKTW